MNNPPSSTVVRDRRVGPTARPRRTWYGRFIATGPLVAYCLVAGWLSVAFLASSQRDLGLAFAAIASFVALVTMRQGRATAERQKERLSRALAAADRRNRELERLRDLAAGLLAGNDLAALNRQIALAAADLLEAEGGAIMLVVEEGRFVRVVAGSGPLLPAVGSLVPMERSLVGYVIVNDEAVLVDNMEQDPRNHPHEQLTGRLTRWFPRRHARRNRCRISRGTARRLA